MPQKVALIVELKSRFNTIIVTEQICEDNTENIFMSASNRYIDIPRITNMRDLGEIKAQDGKKVKINKIIRSGEISRLTESDWDFLFNEKQVRHLCDLRRKDEQNLYPIIVPNRYSAQIKLHTWDYDVSSIEDMAKMTEAIRNHLKPLATMNDEQLLQWIEASYARYSGTAYMCAEHYKGIFKILIDMCTSNGSMIIFCGAGKDRTGFAAAFILAVLGVSIEDILDDYVLTTEAYQLNPVPKEHLMPLFRANGLDELPDKVLDAMCVAHRKAMETALNSLISNSGTLMAFIKETYEIKDEDIEILRSNLLE